MSNSVPPGYKLKKKTSLKKRAINTAIFVGLGAGAIALSYAAAKAGAQSALDKGHFNVSFEVPDGYDLVQSLN